MNPLKIQLGQPVSFVIGNPPVKEVFANGVMLVFEDDKTYPSPNEGSPPTIVKGKAVLMWGVSEGQLGVHAHRVEVKLDDATTESLRKLVVDKTRESLASAAQKSRGG